MDGLVTDTCCKHAYLNSEYLQCIQSSQLKTILFASCVICADCGLFLCRISWLSPPKPRTTGWWLPASRWAPPIGLHQAPCHGYRHLDFNLTWWHIFTLKQSPGPALWSGSFDVRVFVVNKAAGNECVPQNFCSVSWVVFITQQLWVVKVISGVTKSLIGPHKIFRFCTVESSVVLSHVLTISCLRGYVTVVALLSNTQLLLQRGSQLSGGSWRTSKGGRPVPAEPDWTHCRHGCTKRESVCLS